MKFNVPYYAQSSEFTCGPACVLMVMKHFDRDLEIGRELEFEVWRQCNMIGIKGADPFGLSVPLIDSGYDVRLITQRSRTVEHDAWRRRLLRTFLLRRDRTQYVRYEGKPAESHQEEIAGHVQTACRCGHLARSSWESSSYSPCAYGGHTLAQHPTLDRRNRR